MRNVLNVLDPTGHLELVWNTDDESEVAKARAEVLRLKQAGYSFFIADNGVADEVAAGHGKLEVRRVEAEALLSTPAPTEPTTEYAEIAAATEETPRRRGRPPKAEGVQAVATRPLRGG